MTDKLTLWVPRLTANRDDRTLSGLLLPFGEEGRTNLGRLTASEDTALDLGDDVTLNVEHDPKRPIGRPLGVERTPEGLRASWRIVETRDGDDALTEAAEGLRAGFSVELEPIVTRGGRIVSGTLQAAGLVARPAFPSARLAAAEDVVVPDMGDAADDPQDPAEPPAVVIDGEALPNVESVDVTPERIDITTTDRTPADGEYETTNDALAASEPEPKENPMTATARVQNAALVAARTDEPKTDAATLFGTLAGVHKQALSPARMEAALSDIVPGDILGIEQPQYVGQMWQGVPYARKYIPVFEHADLTSFEIKGWDWADGKKPTVGLYTGNKTDIPSNDVETVATAGVLQRIAGGHDIDRKFRDFSNVEFWEKYFAAMAESYAKVSDTYIRDQIKAIPTAGNGQRVHLLTGVAPAGVPTALWQIVEGCVKMIDDLDVLPTAAFVTSDYWKPLLYTKVNDVLAYLDAALNLEGGTLASGGFKIIPVPVGSLTNGAWVGKSLVVHKSAVRVYELPGSPIRVEAEAISKGGIDEALFGYAGYQTENVKGVISFDAPAAS